MRVGRIAEVARPILRLLEAEIAKGNVEVRYHERERELIPVAWPEKFKDQWFSIQIKNGDHGLKQRIQTALEELSKNRNCCLEIAGLREPLQPNKNHEFLIFFTPTVDVLFNAFNNLTQRAQRGMA